MAIDPKLIDDLNSRRKKVILSGGQEKIDKRHEKGEMTARDRMGYLFEEGTFSEIGMHVRHNCHNFGMGKKEIPGDGVVSGFGLVDGRPVACAASDFLAQGGSLGYMHAMKIADAQKYALKAGIPMVTVNDSGGARLQEGVGGEAPEGGHGEKRGSPCSGTAQFMSCRISEAPVARMAPSRMRAWHPSEECRSTGPGMQKTSRPCSAAVRAVIKAPLRPDASTTSVARLQPLTMRLRMGKVVREGGKSIGNSETTAPCPSAMRCAKFLFSRGYSLLSPAPITAMVRPSASMAPVWASVSTPRASPEMTVTPASARSWEMFLAQSLP